MEYTLDRLKAMDRAELEELFPRLDVSAVPNLQEYAWEEWHEGSLGAGDCFLADETAAMLGLRPGMRVLELGSGRGANACFLARHYGVEVCAVDLHTDPAHVMERAERQGVADLVIPLQCDARSLPFAYRFFDAALSLNAYFYFGTDDTFLPYLSRFFRPGGMLAVASPCFAREPDIATPAHFRFDAPDYLEFYAMHSPAWWRQHMIRYEAVELLSCGEHRLGREIWLDSMRWQLQTRPLEDILPDVRRLLQDEERFLTYLSLLVRFRP